MIHNYYYGRLSDGYACINREELPFESRDFDRLKNLASYAAPEERCNGSLPEQFYFYNDETETGEVGIVGRTVPVRGGSGISGDRDTSFSQKYIYTDGDYDSLLKNPSDIFEGVGFFDSPDEVLEGKAPEEFELPFIDGAEILRRFGISEERFIRLLYCCIEAFADPECRVYIYLPQSDRETSLLAAALMRMIFEILPSFILENAGFLTFSPVFDSNAQNPVPNGISVIFVERTRENLYRGSRLNEKNFVFDFESGLCPQLNIPVNIVEMLEALRTNAKLKSLLDSCLSGMFLRGTRVTCEALYSVLVLSADLEPDDAEVMAEKRTAVLEILQLLPSGMRCGMNTPVFNAASALLESSEADNAYLDFAGRLCFLVPLFRDKASSVLCDIIMSRLDRDDIDGVFDITDYEYEDEALNDLLLDRIYSTPDYFGAGELIFLASVEPVMNRKNVPLKARLEKVLEFISSSLAEKYGEFVKSFCIGYVIGQVSACMECVNVTDTADARTRMERYEVFFDEVRDIEELLSRYVTCLGEEARSFLRELCGRAVAGIEGNYRKMTSSETKDIIALWKDRYFGDFVH